MAPRRTFGRTWWGRAWVAALEQRAQVDPNRLPRGRTYARKGTVRELAVAPGEITAWVRGSRPEPYRVTIRMRQFTSEEWDVLLEVAGRRLGHAAALLDAELPEELAEQSREAGADLLPGPGDLRPRCSCPDSANPCKHVAAVYYLVADEVDADPFVLFTLRGRPRDEVLARLRELRAPRAGKPARAPDPGLTPKQAYARRVGPVPPLPAVPAEPGPPAVLDLDPPARTGWTAAALGDLVADAASLAWEMLRGQGIPAPLTFEEDVARRAARRLGESAAGVDRGWLRRGGPGAFAAAFAARDGAGVARGALDSGGLVGRGLLDGGPDGAGAARGPQNSAMPTSESTPERQDSAGPLPEGLAKPTAEHRDPAKSTTDHNPAPNSTHPTDLADLATAAGVSPADLATWAQAWREAGRSGLAALREPWTPGPAPLAQARADLAETGLPGDLRTWRNRVTLGRVQLRYGRDHRWYRFVRTAGRWWLDGPPADRPVTLAYPAD